MPTPTRLRALPHILLLSFLATNATLHAKTARLRIVWQADPAHEATIAWDQVSGQDPAVHVLPRAEWKEGKDKTLVVKPERKNNFMGMHSHFASLKGLKPDTAYQFVIKDSEGESSEAWFCTAPDHPQPFTFIAGGDTKSPAAVRERGRRTNRMVAKLRPLFVVFDGDFTSAGVRPQEWKNWLSDWAADTRSADGRIYPLVPVRGNHEMKDETLYHIFGLSSRDNYYAFSVGGDLLRFYTLNVHLTPAAKFQAQTAWLRADMDQHASTSFKISAYHKPLRPHTRMKAENHNLYKAWAQLFLDKHMNLAIEGDSHMHKITYPIRPSKEKGSSQGFIRDDTRGTMFIGEGSWGAGTRKNDDDKPWTMQSGSFAQFKWAHVFPDKILLHTVITEKGKVDQVPANTEDNLFAIPEGITLFDDGKHGKVVKLPLIPWK